MTPSREMSRLIDIMAQLRTPVTGCPWDLQQSFETIAPYTIEEAYEVADAISRGDMNDLCDELGDLLLQVVYHARLAQEQGAFAFDDVVLAITRKLIRRHPHVFATPTATFRRPGSRAHGSASRPRNARSGSRAAAGRLPPACSPTSRPANRR